MEITLLILHILGAGLLIGLVVITTIIVFMRDLSDGMLRTLLKVRWLGLAGSVWQLVTGGALYYLEREELNDSKIFWTKLGLYVLEGIIISLVIDRKIKRERASGSDVVAATKKLRFAFLFHALLIIAIVILGVLLANAEH